MSITEDFLQSIKNVLVKRPDDEWSQLVSSKICSDTELIGVNVVYHQNCRIGFRTNKSLPKNNKSTAPTFSYKKGFLDIVNLIRNKKKAQYSIKDLIDEMNIFSDGNAYSFNQMKTNLMQYFGNEIIISTFQNKRTLVTLQTTCHEILNEFYESSKTEMANHQVIRKASDVILDDIKSVAPNKCSYPSASDISLCDTQQFLPASLMLLLSHIITGYNSPLKIVSIGQAIVQACHRENVLAPLQLALAVQMHHFTGSK